MYAIKINERLARDDKGWVYKYSSPALAEIAAKVIMREMLIQEFEIVKFN